MNIEFKKLTEVSKQDFIDLMNHPLVRKQMPLLKGGFTEEAYETFAKEKEKHWQKHGFGLWAFVKDKEFIGWGGFQMENGDADLALVLHPTYWGMGKYIYRDLICQAFHEFGFELVTVLLPPTRTRIKGLLRLGLREVGELVINSERFIRYRLKKIDTMAVN